MNGSATILDIVGRRYEFQVQRSCRTQPQFEYWTILSIMVYGSDWCRLEAESKTSYHHNQLAVKQERDERKTRVSKPVTRRVFYSRSTHGHLVGDRNSYRVHTSGLEGVMLPAVNITLGRLTIQPSPVEWVAMGVLERWLRLYWSESSVMLGQVHREFHWFSGVALRSLWRHIPLLM